MKELKKSLKQLGIKGHVIATKKSDLICISVNGIYIGLWSPKRNTFVELTMASQTTKQRGDNTMKKDYTKTMNYAVVSMIDRSTQDDYRSKIQIAGLFENPIVAEDSFIPYLPNKEVKRYILRVEDLERFEEFYNFIQDLNEKHGEKAIFHLSDGGFSVDEENRFRQILNIWTDTKIA